MHSSSRSSPELRKRLESVERKSVGIDSKLDFIRLIVFIEVHLEITQELMTLLDSKKLGALLYPLCSRVSAMAQVCPEYELGERTFSARANALAAPHA